MSRFDYTRAPYGEFFPTNESFGGQAKASNREKTLQYHASTHGSKSIGDYCNIIYQKQHSISAEKLNDILDKLQKKSTDQQRIDEFNEILLALFTVDPSTLVKVAKHPFFNLLEKPTTVLLEHWLNDLIMDEKQLFFFRNVIKLCQILFDHSKSTDLQPSWLLNSSFLDIVAEHLRKIPESDNYFSERYNPQTKIFMRLFNIYVEYQDLLNQERYSDKDTLIKLVDPIVRCLTSQNYIKAFDSVQRTDGFKTKSERFYLLKCPSFISSYNGPYLEKSMNALLPVMMDEYTNFFNKIVPHINTWNKHTYQAVYRLLDMMDHGAKNGKFLANHLPFIDHLLTLLNQPTLYKKLRKDLVNQETDLIDKTVDLLNKAVDDPVNISYIKEKKAAPTLIRLTTAECESIKDNAYNLLGQISTEEDIKNMESPGELLVRTTAKLKALLKEKPDDQDQIPKLLETLKGLAQHDSIKETIVAQEILPFLLECVSRFANDQLTSILEVIWTVSFYQKAAEVIKSDKVFLQKLDALTQTSNNEAIRSASQGLNWKLIQEAAFLERASKRNQTASGQDEVITEVVIGEDGKEKIITKKKYADVQPGEQQFQYDMMISYCHADKEIVHKIDDFLQAQGFKIWIDRNHMFGPAMSAMAEAVENSEFVLICMSEPYKKSTYCQAEAEYAFGCKRRLIPLKVQKGYKADGWLGFMIGARIYIDYGHFDFDTACEKLMNEISLQRKRPLPSKTGAAQVTENKPAPAVNKSHRASQLPERYTKRNALSMYAIKHPYIWTESDVLDFLFYENLKELMPLCEEMDGPAFIQLCAMCADRTTKAFRLIATELKSKHKIELPISTYSRFLSAVQLVMANGSSPNSSSLQIEEIIDKPTTQNINKSYDILITSNVPPDQIFRYAENWMKGTKAIEYSGK